MLIHVTEYNNDSDVSCIYDLFCDAFYVYRSIKLKKENLDLNSSIPFDWTCPACPRQNENGDIYVAIDGNLRLFRYRSASKYNWDQLKTKVMIMDAPDDIAQRVFLIYLKKGLELKNMSDH